MAPVRNWPRRTRCWEPCVIRARSRTSAALGSAHAKEGIARVNTRTLPKIAPVHLKISFNAVFTCFLVIISSRLSLRMEQQILFLINRQWTSPALDLFMAIITDFALWTIPLLLAVIGFFLFGGFKGRAAVISILLVVAVGDGIVAGSLKHLIGRPRPHEILADVRCVRLLHVHPKYRALFKAPKIALSRPKSGTRTGSSFPSAHTLDNFCAATVLTAFYRRRGWLYFIPASLIAYSRIYTGSHWPSDVAVSIFLGIGIALLCLVSFEKLWRGFAPKLFPRLAANHPHLIEGVHS